MSTILELDPRQTIIVAIFVLFLGKYLTSKVEVLREYNIPSQSPGVWSPRSSSVRPMRRSGSNSSSRST